MARRTTVTLVDDIDGSEADESVSFGLDRADYEIDLSESNAGALRDVLAPARRTGGRRGSTTPRREASAALSTNRRSRTDTREIRAWAVEHGATLPARGRLAASVVEAFDANDPSKLTDRHAEDTPGSIGHRKRETAGQELREAVAGGDRGAQPAGEQEEVEHHDRSEPDQPELLAQGGDDEVGVGQRHQLGAPGAEPVRVYTLGSVASSRVASSPCRPRRRRCAAVRDRSRSSSWPRTTSRGSGSSIRTRGDIGQRQAKVAQGADRVQARQIVGRVAPVPGIRALGGHEQPDLVVVTKRPHGQARGRGHLSDAPPPLAVPAAHDPRR